MSLEAVRDVNAQIEKIVCEVQRKQLGRQKFPLNTVIQTLRDRNLISEEYFNPANTNLPQSINLEEHTSKETYAKLFQIQDIIREQYGSETLDL